MAARHPARLLVVLAALAFALAACSSSGGRTVTVTHAAVTLEYVDLGASGASVGDERVTAIAFNVDGGGTGRLDAVLTTTAVNAPNPGDEIRIGHLVFMFGTGPDQLVVDGTSAYPAQSATIAQDSSTVRPIVGGSGAYAGARGWAESFHLADGTWRHVFHLS
jgi:hypothetical protein